MKRITNTFVITNKFVPKPPGAKHDQFFRGGFWIDCSGLVLKTQDPDFGIFLKDLRLHPSEITLRVHDFKTETNEDGSIKEEIREDGSRSTSYLVIAEPLEFQGEELCTLQSVGSTILSHLNLTKEMVPGFYTRHRFSSRFKKFIRKTIKLIEEKSRQNIYINVSPGTIFITADQKLRLFGLPSHFASVEESYKSLHSTIKQVVYKRFPEGGYIEEIGHFITSPSVPMGLNMCRHPSLLLPGQKLDMFRKLFHALKCFEISDGLDTYYWTQNFAKYEVLNELLTRRHGGSVLYNDCYEDLLRATKDMIIHFNLNVIKVADKDGHHFSPLDDKWRLSSYVYTRKEIETIIDRLYSGLATWCYQLVINNRQINEFFGTPKLDDL